MNNLSLPEKILLDHVKRLERHCNGKIAIHLSLSKLKHQYQKPNHMRIAVNVIEKFAVQNEGHIFLLDSSDIIIICHDTIDEKIENVIKNIENTFINDPLIAANISNADKKYFVDIFNLEIEYESFLRICSSLYQTEASKRKDTSNAIDKTVKKQNTQLQPLSPEQLGKLENFLINADLSNLLHRQNICMFSDKMVLQPIFKELFISISELAKAMLPDVNLAVNQWLFQHLTQTLDLRVLKMLMQTDDKYLKSSFSLNLNIATLLSKNFLEFDADLSRKTRNTLVIEMRMVDIMSNFSDFIFAINFIRRKGYRTCLDGVTSDMLPYIDRKQMKFDMLKINTDFNFYNDGTEKEFAAIKSHIERIGKEHVILARCDDKIVVSNGLKMGIKMFQGYYIDKLQRDNKNKPSTELEKKRISLTAKR